MMSDSLPTWNKLQILEAGQKLKTLLTLEGFEPEYITYVECVTEDIIQILEGRMSAIPCPPQEAFSPPPTATPEGFVMDVEHNQLIPLLGTWDVSTGKIDWHTEDKNDR